MAANEYLANILSGQNLSDAEVVALRQLRARIEAQLSVLQGNPRFYYGGSFGKRTMIRANYDLDLVMYWPNGTSYPIRDLYNAVGQTLKRHWNSVNSKTVGWELPFDGGFHIDVVPGRALDNQYYEANLYRTDTGTTLKTSLKGHIDTVRNSGRSDAIRLMKLWKIRRRVPFKKSFLLELMTIEGCRGKLASDLQAQALGALAYIRDNIRTCNVIDPTNSNNSLSDDLDMTARSSIQHAAHAALRASYWSEVFQ